MRRVRLALGDRNSNGGGVLMLSHCTFRLEGECRGEHRHVCTRKRCGRVVLSPYADPRAIHAVCRGPLWNRLASMRGLGDLVAWLLSLVGIRKTPDCECSQRQERLNQLVPFSTTTFRNHTNGNRTAKDAKSAKE